MRLKYFIFFLFLLISQLQVEGQTPGLIIKPALAPGNAVLDPDGDGYVSQKRNGIQAGFTIPPDNDVMQSEIPFVAIIRPDPTGDLLRGPVGSFSEIVGVDAAGNNAILTYNDGINLLFRFRLGGYAPNSKTYAIFIDTDGKFGFTGPNADPNAIPGNPGFEAEIDLQTNFNVKAFNINGRTTGIEVESQPYDTNCQKSMALSTAGGDPDYFYDFFLPLSSLTSLFTSSTPLRFVATTVMNPNEAMGNNALSDVGGVTTGNNIDAIFEDLVDAQTPTVPGEEVLDRSACPTINSVNTVSATISGTSTEASGTLITIYIYQSNGTTLVGSNTTHTTGSTWSIAPPVALVAGYIIKATATATGKGASYDNCDIETVTEGCVTLPAAPTLTSESSKGVCGTIETGATLNVYKDGILLYSTSTGENGIIQISGTGFSYKPNGSFQNCNSGTSDMANGFYEFSQTIAGCESLRSSYSLACAGVSTVPVISAPVYAGVITIAGTSGASASVELFIDNISSGTTTASAGGAWSFASKTVAAGQVVKVVATETNTCLAGTSNLITVVALPSPVIIGTFCGTVTEISGYINASSGTIQIYKTGSPDVVVGSAVSIASNGDWKVTGLSVSSGSIYAKASLNGGVTSTSSSVTIGAKTSHIPVITTPTITEGATTISGTGTDGDVIKLYIDGAVTSYTATVSSGSWTINPILSYEFYIGASVTVTATATGLCEGDPSATKIVQCNSPSIPTYTGGSKSYCLGGTGQVTLNTTSSGVIYQLVDASGVAQGPSSVGNGSGIALYTYALNSNLSGLYIKAYKATDASCSATSSTAINFNTQSLSPTVSFPTKSLSASQGTTSLDWHFDSKSTSPSADTYTIEYSVAAISEGFVNVNSLTALPGVAGAAGDIPLIIPAGAATGTYNGTIKIYETSGSSCTTGYSFTITIYAAGSPPVISVQPYNADVCSGATANLTVSASSDIAISYQWQSCATYNGTFTNDAGTSGSTTNSYVTAALAGTTYYRVIVANTNGSVTSNVVEVTVTSAPEAAGLITGTTPVCAGQSSILYSINTLPGATSYTWTYSGTNVSTSGSTTTTTALNFALNATSGNLVVYGSNSCGNGTSSTKAITVNAAPSIIAMTATACSGALFDLTPVNGSNGIVPGGTTNVWSAPVVTGGLTGGASGSGSSISGTLTNPTTTTQTATYTVTPTSVSCTGNTFTVTISVTSPISPSASAVNTICNSEITPTGSINLTVTGGTPGYTYAWTKTGGGFSATTQNLSGLAAGTYNVLVTDSKSAPGCTGTASATVLQPDAMVITPTITNVLCNGNNTGEISIGVTGGTGAKTYLWENGSSANPRTGLTAGTYSVTVTDANGCTKSSGDITITEPSALIATASASAISCNGGTTTISVTASGGTGAGTYQYSLDGGAHYQGGNSFAGKAASASPYIVTVKDGNDCITTASVTVTQPGILALSTVLTNPTCPVSASVSNSNGAISLTVGGGTGTKSYTWSASNGGSVPALQVNSQNLSNIQAGTYSVLVSDANGCTANTSVTLTAINQSPNTPGTITK